MGDTIQAKIRLGGMVLWTAAAAECFGVWSPEAVLRPAALPGAASWTQARESLFVAGLGHASHDSGFRAGVWPIVSLAS
jgi:hypothetical protein